jgi:hypothetical protein
MPPCDADYILLEHECLLRHQAESIEIFLPLVNSLDVAA